MDGIFTAQHSPALLGEALGITPRYVDGTSVGGCSFMILVEHAVAALHHHHAMLPWSRTVRVDARAWG